MDINRWTTAKSDYIFFKLKWESSIHKSKTGLCANSDSNNEHLQKYGSISITKQKIS